MIRTETGPMPENDPSAAAEVTRLRRLLSAKDRQLNAYREAVGALRHVRDRDRRTLDHIERVMPRLVATARATVDAEMKAEADAEAAAGPYPAPLMEAPREAQ